MGRVAPRVLGKRRLLTVLAALVGVVLLAGCARESGGTSAPAGAPETAPEKTTPTRAETSSPAEGAAGSGEREQLVPKAEGAPSYGYTYGDHSGNRAVEGSGGLPGSDPVDVWLSGEPAWVVGAPLGDDVAWVVALEDGRIEAFRHDTESGSVRPWPVSPDRLPALAPPAVAVEGEELRLLATGGRASDSTHPVPVSPGEASRGSLVVAEDGGLFVEREGSFAPVGEPQEVRALPDARAARASDGRLAVLTEPTGRYVHGVIGDDLEAESITVLEPTDAGLEVAGRLFAESGGVFELVSPLWFEGPDGRELLAVTESAEGQGSRIAVYDPEEGLLAAGSFFGEPQRWRHLLAAGPFGPNGEVEIAAIRTPHIGGMVEFYGIDAQAGELRIAATQPGYSSHTIYSRNLDAARAGDLDGDGAFELLVPSQDGTELGAVRRVEGGANVAWTLPVGGVLATNLAATAAPDGRVAVAAGREGGALRIWP
ncbi:MAG: hypothetical protein M3R38_24785 [Actinomycetota bacterium]|nr:hypothetical protein [Actinomycetota bacterium]